MQCTLQLCNARDWTRRGRVGAKVLFSQHSWLHPDGGLLIARHPREAQRGSRGDPPAPFDSLLVALLFLWGAPGPASASSLDRLGWTGSPSHRSAKPARATRTVRGARKAGALIHRTGERPLSGGRRVAPDRRAGSRTRRAAREGSAP